MGDEGTVRLRVSGRPRASDTSVLTGSRDRISRSRVTICCSGSGVSSGEFATPVGSRATRKERLQCWRSPSPILGSCNATKRGFETDRVHPRSFW